MYCRKVSKIKLCTCVALALLHQWKIAMQGLARNFGDLLAATVFIAVGASVHMPLAISLISDLLPARLSL